ncbi:MAG: HEAT repeat domain-containing protein [Spirulina sp. SIO3F2]|nr:HEAT repeat domain-containing protein [Spirulina sp. SIO3F2]
MRRAVVKLCEHRAEASVLKLIEVLGYNNPGAAIAAVDGLIAIGRPAVDLLLDNIDSFDYGARAWANRALAGIGDPRALPNLLDAALNDFALSVRRVATKGLGNLQWDWLDTVEWPTAQEQVLQALTQAGKDEEWVVRYAAVVALENFGSQIETNREAVLASLQTCLATEVESVVCARIHKALKTLKAL